jgi:hypothetical protein
MVLSLARVISKRFLTVLGVSMVNVALGLWLCGLGMQ